MSDELELPRFFDQQAEISYTAAQLSPTLARLRDAVADVEADEVSAPALITAWTRLAELRLPRKAAPAALLAEVEELVVRWDRHAFNGSGGIAACAYALSAAERLREAGRIRAMLAAVEAAALAAPDAPIYRTE